MLETGGAGPRGIKEGLAPHLVERKKKLPPLRSFLSSRRRVEVPAHRDAEIRTTRSGSSWFSPAVRSRRTGRTNPPSRARYSRRTKKKKEPVHFALGRRERTCSTEASSSAADSPGGAGVRARVGGGGRPGGAGVRARVGGGGRPGGIRAPGSTLGRLQAGTR